MVSLPWIVGLLANVKWNTLLKCYEMHCVCVVAEGFFCLLCCIFSLIAFSVSSSLSYFQVAMSSPPRKTRTRIFKLQFIYIWGFSYEMHFTSNENGLNCDKCSAEWFRFQLNTVQKERREKIAFKMKEMNDSHCFMHFFFLLFSHSVSFALLVKWNTSELKLYAMTCWIGHDELNEFSANFMIIY